MGGVRSIYNIIILLFMVTACGRYQSIHSPERDISFEARIQAAGTRDCQAGDLGPLQMHGIIGGLKAASAGEIARRTVLLSIVRDKRESLCTGTLIANDVVLTAAHCVQVPASQIQVLFTTDYYCDWAKGTLIESEVEKVLAHPKFDRQKAESMKDEASRTFMQISQFDVALVKLSKPAPSSSRIMKLEFASESPFTIVGGAGYGLMTKDASADEDPTLQWTYLKLNPHFNANEKNFLGITDSLKQNFYFVDQSSSGGICLGDSGGPLFSFKGGLSQIGVASFVFNADSSQMVCGGKGVYLRLSTQREWLRETFMQLQSQGVNPFL